MSLRFVFKRPMARWNAFRAFIVKALSLGFRLPSILTPLT